MRPPASPRPPRRPEPPAKDHRPDPPEVPPDPPAPPAARVVVPRREPASAVVRRGVGTVSTGLRERLAERDAAARRLLLYKTLITVVGLAVLVTAGWLVLASSVLALRPEGVLIEGTGTTVDPAEVRAAVEPEIGTPLARLDLGGVRERIEAMPTVAAVDLARDWPHGLAVTIDSREPVAAAASGGGYVLLDPDGVQVGSVGQVPEGLPEVTVPLADEERTAPALGAVLEVLDSLPGELLADVRQAGASSAHGVELVLDDDATVRWGSAEENDLKVAVLEVLRQRPAAVYDVSVPRAPTTRD